MSFIKDSIIISVIALAIVLPIRIFIFQPFLVNGDSMNPNFAHGDYLIVDEISYRFGDPVRGDVIVFKYPRDTSQKYIKRIVGLPGETVEVRDDAVFVNGTEVEEVYIPENISTEGIDEKTLGEGEFYVLGDNRKYSSDSRKWGVLKENFIIGKAAIRVFPFNNIGSLPTPIY